jgi:hypothetical protein
MVTSVVFSIEPQIAAAVEPTAGLSAPREYCEWLTMTATSSNAPNL